MVEEAYFQAFEVDVAREVRRLAAKAAVVHGIEAEARLQRQGCLEFPLAEHFFNDLEVGTAYQGTNEKVVVDTELGLEAHADETS